LFYLPTVAERAAVTIGNWFDQDLPNADGFVAEHSSKRGILETNGVLCIRLFAGALFEYTLKLIRVSGAEGACHSVIDSDVSR
jgi:hypothetical protein